LHAKEAVLHSNDLESAASALPATPAEKMTASTASSPTVGSLKMTPLSADKSASVSSAIPIKMVTTDESSNTVDQPSINIGRPDVTSPTLTSMKEVFDVSYAVHRMAEENARRKALAASNPNGPPAAFSALQAMNNIDEDEDEEAYGLTTDNSDSSQSADSGEESDHPTASAMTNQIKVQMDNLRLKNPPGQRLQQSQRERVAAHLKGSASKPASERTSAKSASKKSPFELKIGNATLLEKRKQRQQLPNAPVVQG